MPDRSLIVIGAGLAGLAAGIHAQRNGYRTQDLRARVPARRAWPLVGVAASYLIDGGIHFLMGHKPGQPTHRIYEEVGTAEPGSCVDMHDYGVFVDEETGRELAVTADLDALLADWSRLSPADAPVMAELVRATRALIGSGALNLGMGDPPELASRFAGLAQMWQMRSVLRYFGGPTGQTIGERSRAIQDPWLRAGLREPVPAASAGVVRGDGAWRCSLPAGWGCSRAARPGSSSRWNAASRISAGRSPTTRPWRRSWSSSAGTGGDRAVGVRLSDGSEHRAGAVISAADGRSTLFEMLDGRYLDAATRERFEKWALITPTR